MGLQVTRPKDSEADLVISGRRFEIKGSTLWEAGMYKFQQVRRQNYDALICLGLSPFDAHCWIISKAEVLVRWDTREIQPQHGGSSGRDTAWLDINPNAPPEWLVGLGGSLSEAKRILRGFLPPEVGEGRDRNREGR